MSEDTKNTLSRRTFLKIAATTGIAHLFDLKPKSEAKQDKPEIIGLIPKNFSETIRKNHLIPRVPSREEGHETTINSAVDYLANLENALIENPDTDLPVVTFMDLGKYPVAILPDWKLSDVIKTFQDEFKRGQIKITTMEDIEDPGAVLDTLNTFKNNERSTEIRVSTNIFKEGLFEEDTFVYPFLTNTELALLMLHEYIHALQDEAANQMAQAQGISLDDEQINIDNKFQKEFPGVAINEAQANAFSFLGLFLLNKLNNSEHFPGTEQQDPTGVQFKALQDSNPNYKNLYTVFKNTVLKTKTVDNPDWLAQAA